MRNEKMKYFNLLIILIASVQYLVGGITGKLTGFVKDQNTNEPLIGCNIMIKGTPLGTASDQNGEYFILNIGPGTYSIEFQMIGYSKYIQNGVLISVDKTTRINALMKPSVIEGETVTVQAERKLIQFDVTQSESIVTSEEIDEMAVTEVSDVLRLQAGITEDAGGGLHMRGGRTSEVSYMVDGIPVSDNYDGGISVKIENDNIQELQVISGTFNAEYGKALTGVVNMVTKDGGDKFDGSFHAYTGDHVTSDKVFSNLSSFNIANDYSLSGSLSGPILPGRITFYSSARTNQSKGWLNGLQTFTIYGDTVFQDNNNNKYFDAGDEKKDPYYSGLNGFRSWSLQNKVTIRLRPVTVLKINSIVNSRTGKDYNHSLQLVKDAQQNNYNQGNLINLSLSHSFSPMTFLQFNVSEHTYGFQSRLFDDPLDDRYITPDSLFWAHVQGTVPGYILEKYGDQVVFYPAYSFYRFGVDTRRFERETKTKSIKFDFTSQINKYNQVKFGFAFSNTKLTFDNYSLLDSSESDRIYTPYVPEVGSFSRDTYEFNPNELAFYLQDKIEYGDMIINIGARFERFDANSQTPNNIHEPYISNPRNPALDSLSMDELENINWGDISYTEIDSAGNIVSHTYADYYARFNDQPNLGSSKGWWKNTTVKTQISPRVAVAYPISDKGVIHFAYGYFFKIPDLSLLYNGIDYKLTETGTNFGIFGNPDLKPETTVSYELGLKQEIAVNTRMELRAFYRDARNYVSSGIPIDLGDGKSYFTYVNKDYSNSRGIIATFYRRLSSSLGGQIDYTYQIAEGANSDPTEEFGAVLAGNEPTRSIIPLDWDQTHNINGSLFASTKNWGANAIFQLGSGYPYTPFITNYEMQGEVLSNVLKRNSRRKPMTFRVDLKLQRKFELMGVSGKIYLSIYNATDRRNQINVYADSGSSSETIEKRRANILSPFEPLRPNTINEYFNRPDWYDHPRQIQFGLQVSL
tara:strand:- start:385 stop:3306 length:2922 start_codon:yes stop_codon:yes gene_type:complete